MNGYLWRIIFVDPNSPKLVDRTGESCKATTDPIDKCVYLSNNLSGDLFNTVLIHELGHCTMVSYGLIEEIHRMVIPEYWVEAEEFMCNFIADYGLQMFKIAYELFGENAWMFIPYELGRLVA